MNKHIRVAFDVDGTLLRLDGTPNYDVISQFKLHEKQGCDMLVWSGGGIDYAKHQATKLGLRAHTLEKKYRSDIDICYDDQEVNLAKVNIQVVS